MFFSPELLSRRDSGFGLLWLAATLGAKSSFKKLPKRSVLTADIAQLCDLIAKPEEPLALRLSSNLMVGVARVYKVKHEIFLADVTTCFNALKKAITEINMASSVQLQMGQSNARLEALTLAVDPTNALVVNFSNLFMDWDDSFAADNTKDRDDQDFDPSTKKPKQKKKSKLVVPSSENPRANPHTLNEDLSHLLSTSFDASFSENNPGGAGADPLSSQNGDIFGFEDNFLAGPHDLDLTGDIGDELAKELGEGWGANDFNDPMNVGQPLQFGDHFAIDLGFGGDMLPQLDRPEIDTYLNSESRHSKKRPLSDSDKENRFPSWNESGRDPALLSRQVSSAPPEPIADSEPGKEVAKRTRKMGKGGQLIVDERTELTADELKDSRARYMERQNILRYDLDAKRREREAAQLVGRMLWSIPHDIMAPEIIAFWRENLKARMEATMGGATGVDAPQQSCHWPRLSIDEPPKKRRKTKDVKATIPEVGVDQLDMGDTYQDVDMNMDVDFGNDLGNKDNNDIGSARLRSSEVEPGQARNISRPSSFHLDLRLRGVEGLTVGSQKGALFPWDNAGVSSSSAPAFDFVEGTPIESADIRLRRRSSHSLSRRDSPMLRSVAASPAQFALRNSRLSVDEFEFQLPAEDSVVESQPETSLLTVERNSFNFLEYAKMQLQTLPAANILTFEDIVPNATTTRHIAAAAFYHCLVLATKHLVVLRQEQPYDNVEISIK